MIKRILSLGNEIEAQRIKNILDQNNIPHLIRTFHDSAYDGLFQNQYGWGLLEADSADEQKILQLLKELDTDHEG
jgi:hypothetical protein